MKSFPSLFRHTIHSSPARIIPLIFLTSFLNAAICAGAESPLKRSDCEKAPAQCASLCQTDLLAEARVKESEEYSKKTRVDAARASKRAASVEKEVNKQLRKMGLLKDTVGTEAENRNSKPLLKAAGVVSRVLVSEEANARANAEGKEARQPGTNRSSESSNKNPWELLEKKQTALREAEEAQQVSAAAKIEADQARAHAESTRQSYKSCLGGN